MIRDAYAFIREIVMKFAEHEIALRASALAFSALLSLFPLLLFMLFLTTQFVQDVGAREALSSYLSRVIPQLAGTVDSALEEVFRSSASLGIVAGLGLLWTASAVFTILSTTFNIIWDARPRPFWKRRLIGLLAVLVLAILFVFSLLIRTVDALQFAPGSVLGLRGVNLAVDIGVTVVLSWVLYYLMPNEKVNPLAALAGATVAATLWQVAKAGYSIYLEFAISRFDLIYGSLGSVVVLLLWMYFSSLILFLGAEFAARLQQRGS